MAERFSPRIIYLLRRTYGLEDRYTRLRRRGLFTLSEFAELLGASSSTVKAWAMAGHIPSHVYNDKGQRLFDLPGVAAGMPVVWQSRASKALRRGKKWCHQRCCLAAYNSRANDHICKSHRPRSMTASTGAGLFPTFTNGCQLGRDDFVPDRINKE